MSIKCSHLKKYVVRPALKELDLWSPVAEKLILGTCAQESKMGTYLHQLKNGPALGIYQMEPRTYKDIWENYLIYRPILYKKLDHQPRIIYDKNEDGLKIPNIVDLPNDELLIYDLKYATQMCRFHYYRVSESLPESCDAKALAEYWKKYYNTEKGRGTVEEFERNYLMLVD